MRAIELSCRYRACFVDSQAFNVILSLIPPMCTIHCDLVIQRFNDEIILSRRKIRNISLRFIVHINLHGYGLHYYTRSKRFNEEIILCFTVQEEDQFLYKISGSLCSHCLYTCFYMVVACIIMYCQHYQ